MLLEKRKGANMSKRRLLDMGAMTRYQMMSLAMSVVLTDDEEDYYIISGGIKRPRTHAFWMSPFLHGRTDPTQRNTLAKLEADFLRVGTQV